MRKIVIVYKVITIVFLSLLFQGCWGVASVHPIYDKDTVVFLDGLLGDWTDPNEEEFRVLVIEKEGKKSYSFKSVSADGELSGKFAVNLVKLSDSYLMDFLTDDLVLPEGFAIPVHIIYKLEIKRMDVDELELNLYGIDYQLFNDLSDIHKDKIEYEMEKGLVLITAETPQIQEFFYYLDEQNLNIFEVASELKLRRVLDN